MEQVLHSSIDSVICHEVTRFVSCTLDELVQRLPDYSWSQVFAAVDRLSRQGALTLSRAKCFGYVVSIGPLAPPSQSLRDANHQGLLNASGRVSTHPNEKFANG